MFMRGNVIIPRSAAAKNEPRYSWFAGKVVRQDEGEIACTLHFQRDFLPAREEPMKFSFVRFFMEPSSRFHVPRADKKHKPSSRLGSDTFTFHSRHTLGRFVCHESIEERSPIDVRARNVSFPSQHLVISEKNKTRQAERISTRSLIAQSNQSLKHHRVIRSLMTEW